MPREGQRWLPSRVNLGIGPFSGDSKVFSSLVENGYGKIRVLLEL